MSFKDCVDRGVAGGEMDAKRAERVLADHGALFKEFENTMGSTQADYAAAKIIIRQTKEQAAEKRRVKQLAASVAQRNIKRMETHRSISGKLSPGDYLQDLISNKRGAKGKTIAGQYEAIRRILRRDLGEAVDLFRANLVGQRRNPETLKKVTREIFGESTGDPAAARIAAAWAKSSEKARTRFNAAGGHIGKRADWGLPQAHDSTAIRRAGYKAWRAEILPRLDVEAMGRDWNDGVPFTDESLELLLNDAYQAIRTDGYSRRSASAKNGSAMYNRRADHRFFKFKSADDWMGYSAKFGAGEDPFRIMISHLDNIANEIALMEHLGPNPANGYQFLRDAAMSMAQRSDVEEAPVITKAKLSQADSMYDLFTGRTNIPGNPMVAKGFSAIRQYLTSAHLGSAVISSITDFNTQRLSAKFVGMKSFGFMKQMGKLMSDPEFRAEANQAGLIFENAVNMGNAVARFNLEEVHLEGAARLADFTIRSSGLGMLTEVQRQSFGLEYMSTMASKWAKSSWKDLDPKMKRVLEQYGFDENAWAGIQAAKPHTMSNGLQIIRAQDIEEAGRQDVADLYMEAITSMTEFAVPSSDIYGRAAVLGLAKPGTIGGELIRSALQFKAFPITMLTTQISRAVAENYQGRPKNAASYMASLMIGSTLLGALAIQLKDVLKGKDPRDMTDQKFWMAALAQGGGLGIFGDFLFSDQNRFGGGLASTLGGPTVGFANDVLGLTVGNIQEVAQGKETNAGREIVDMLRRYTLGGSLWYLRLAYEREVLDQLQSLIDPNASASFRNKKRNAQSYGGEFFAAPGESIFGSQARLPDLGNAIGQ